MEKHRFHLGLSAKAKEQLDDLQRRTDAASLTEVNRRALAVYDTLKTYKPDQWEVVLGNQSKNEKSDRAELKSTGFIEKTAHASPED